LVGVHKLSKEWSAAENDCLLPEIPFLNFMLREMSKGGGCGGGCICCYGGFLGCCICCSDCICWCGGFLG
jgi:hypothetical protein